MASFCSADPDSGLSAEDIRMVKSVPVFPSNLWAGGLLGRFLPD